MPPNQSYEGLCRNLSIWIPSLQEIHCGSYPDGRVNGFVYRRGEVEET